MICEHLRVLEQAMIAFGRNQEQMRKNLQATFGIFPFGQFEEMGKQNIALFDRALKMLAPYGREETRPSGDAEPKQTEGEDPRLKRLEAAQPPRPDALEPQHDTGTAGLALFQPRIEAEIGELHLCPLYELVLRRQISDPKTCPHGGGIVITLC